MKYLSIALPLVLLGCAEMISSARPVQRYELEQAVHEAVLRELMRDHPPRGAVICIGIRYTDTPVPVYRLDPGATFLARFRDVAPDVHPTSECGLPKSGLGYIQHRPSGRRAVIYEAAIVEWLPNGEAEVSGEWYAADLAGSHCKYRVGREGTKWHVGECRNRVVS